MLITLRPFESISFALGRGPSLMRGSSFADSLLGGCGPLRWRSRLIGLGECRPTVGAQATCRCSSWRCLLRVIDLDHFDLLVGMRTLQACFRGRILIRLHRFRHANHRPDPSAAFSSAMAPRRRSWPSASSRIETVRLDGAPLCFDLLLLCAPFRCRARQGPQSTAQRRTLLGSRVM